MNAPIIAITPLSPPESRRVHILRQLERKLLWLSAWMIQRAARALRLVVEVSILLPAAA